MVESMHSVRRAHDTLSNIGLSRKEDKPSTGSVCTLIAHAVTNPNKSRSGQRVSKTAPRMRANVAIMDLVPMLCLEEWHRWIQLEPTFRLCTTLQTRKSAS
mmetsp:Transcript_15352/g.30218  ORF Transcript_15352/g.30218 Transcript_15352/m.30218 type:complete len:101 (+) Transcript_15352:79-381(+)